MRKQVVGALLRAAHDAARPSTPGRIGELPNPWMMPLMDPLHPPRTKAPKTGLLTPTLPFGDGVGGLPTPQSWTSHLIVAPVPLMPLSSSTLTESPAAVGIRPSHI
jgi:hypothetical protein